MKRLLVYSHAKLTFFFEKLFVCEKKIVYLSRKNERTL